MKNHEVTRNVFVGVDIQNDFIDGSLAVRGGEHVVTPANEVAARVRASGGTVAWTRDWHPAATPHFDTWPVHCVAETNGADFHAELDIKEDDVILSKGMGQTDGYSGWEGVDLDNPTTTLETLTTPEKSERVRIFIGGLATDYCVRATTLDLAGQYYDNPRVALYLLRDAIRGVEMNPGDTERAIKEMREIGVQTIDSETAVQIIGKAGE